MTLKPSRGLRGASVLSAIGLAAVPKAICPACWPLYAAVLSAPELGSFRRRRGSSRRRPQSL